ncbi:formate dehydrogenase accessory sulfurtransferase FdhD [Pseudaquabacterium rugosum]|uniref:Sulfur carrier protein FdhD n=1 Tax=Pseudaquabacterium rugosum TaxID=2984194 RepID=A0ABU9B9W3_9BURK
MKPDDAPLVPPGAQRAPVAIWRDGRLRQDSDWLADEVPVALVYNGISHAVMLASPADLEDFALGFSLSEGLLRTADELYGVDIEPGCDGLTLQLEVASAALARLKERRRSLAGRTGCGLCGTDSLAQVRRALPAPGTFGLPPVLTTAAVAAALRGLRAHQGLQQLTGATHAAAWCAPDGTVRLAREDVGRHNALDKLIGALQRTRRDARADAATRAACAPDQGFVCITSRASVEMVQKAASVGIGTLVAVSAPTALAVQVAREAGLALAGFARGDDLVAYTEAARFGLPAA